MPRKPAASRRTSRTPSPARRAARPLAIRAGGSAAIDAYLATVPEDRREALQALRMAIRAIVPRAEECISYGIPAFRLDGKVVAGFAATRKGCSYFPFSGSTLRGLAKDLAGYDRTKSSLHFTVDEPLPERLIRKLLRARIAEIG